MHVSWNYTTAGRPGVLVGILKQRGRPRATPLSIADVNNRRDKRRLSHDITMLYIDHYLNLHVSFPLYLNNNTVLYHLGLSGLLCVGIYCEEGTLLV